MRGWHITWISVSVVSDLLLVTLLTSLNMSFHASFVLYRHCLPASVHGKYFPSDCEAGLGRVDISCSFVQAKPRSCVWNKMAFVQKIWIRHRSSPTLKKKNEKTFLSLSGNEQDMYSSKKSTRTLIPIISRLTRALEILTRAQLSPCQVDGNLSNCRRPLSLGMRAMILSKAKLWCRALYTETSEKYSKTQTERKLGFGSHDAFKSGEFTCHKTTERYRSIVKQENQLMEDNRDEAREKELLQKIKNVPVEAPKDKEGNVLEPPNIFTI